MKQIKISILLFSFFFMQTEAKKIVCIVLQSKKSPATHRFILPLLAASELSLNLSTVIPILMAVLGSMHFCSPAAPQISLDNVNTPNYQTEEQCN